MNISDFQPFPVNISQNKIELRRVLGKWSTQTGNSKIADILAQCLVSPVRSAAFRANAAREEQKTRVTIEFAGSGKFFGNIEYNENTTVASLLDSLFWRLLGSPGQPCLGTFRLCRDDDFNATNLETLSSDTLISALMSNPSGKKLLLVLKHFENNEQKNNYLKHALSKNPTPELLDRIIDIAQTMTHDWSKNQTLTAICKKLAEMGQVDRALEIAGETTYDWSKSGAIKALAPRLTTPEQVDRALEIAGEMTDDWDKAEILKALVPRLTTPEQIDRALEIAGEMTDDWDKAEILKALVPRLTTPEQIDRALEISKRMHICYQDKFLPIIAQKHLSPAQMFKLISIEPNMIFDLIWHNILTITLVTVAVVITPVVGVYTLRHFRNKN